MEKEPSAFSILIKTVFKNEPADNRGHEDELGIILNFMRITGLKIGELESFNDAAEQNEVLIEEIKTTIKKAQRSSY